MWISATKFSRSPSFRRSRRALRISRSYDHILFSSLYPQHREVCLVRLLCGRPLPKARNGNDRGACAHPPGHFYRHGNNTCGGCGVRKTKRNSSLSHLRIGGAQCTQCITTYNRKRLGQKPRIIQTAGRAFTFPCGCTGIFPKRGESNAFARWVANNWHCRAALLLRGSRTASRKWGYKPINLKTPHSAIRKLMGHKNCVCCGEPLRWVFGKGTTPHLHHNHKTGEMYGFAHPKCNPLALERENERLREEIARLKSAAVAPPFGEAGEP
jgi:hypothetical protein